MRARETAIVSRPVFVTCAVVRRRLGSSGSRPAASTRNVSPPYGTGSPSRDTGITAGFAADTAAGFEGSADHCTVAGIGTGDAGGGTGEAYMTATGDSG